MTQVIRKLKTADAAIAAKEAVKSAKISNEDIVALITPENSVILTEPVKTSLEVKYDSLGYPSVKQLILGMQYDHRVSWIHFDLKDLLWNLNKSSGETFEDIYSKYNFKVVFSRLHDDNSSQTWQFDGSDFEVPRALTKNPGTYSITLIIEEALDGQSVGNYPTQDEEHVERFVAAPILGRVLSSIYNLEPLSRERLDSNQLASLIKPAVLCTLDDEGGFAPQKVELGQKFDNYIRYLKFNPRDITAHLNDFYVYAIFKRQDKFAYSLFEQTDPQDEKDDYSASHPLICWIPTAVMEEPGWWDVAIVAYAGESQAEQEDPDNGNYYCFVSKKMRMKVARNRLTSEDITKDPIISITTNLVTKLGEVIITSDDQLYQRKED